MTAPALALRAAIRARCLPDPALAAAMGGTARLDDEPPRPAPPVYAVFGDGTVRDWSTGSDRGHEHEATIVVWATPGSAASALAAAGRFAELLDGAPLAPAGHRLVNIAVTALETGRERASGLARATLRVRAVTEVVS